MLLSSGCAVIIVVGACVLQDIAPREASVHFQMGRLHKRLGDLDAALACFNAALDLQPSTTDAGLIKAAIDKLLVADEETDDEL